MVMNRIRTVTETPGLGADTPDEYREKQAQIVARQRLRPGFAWLEVAVSQEPIEAYINAGTWRVRCHCGDAPPTHPEWRLACCSGCGTVYESVVFPENIEAITAALVRRPDLFTRNWHQSETVDDLHAENTAHGLAS